jgi:hypothetical protein
MKAAASTTFCFVSSCRPSTVRQALPGTLLHQDQVCSRLALLPAAMPQKKSRKRRNHGASLQLQKVGGYAFTKKLNELQALVRGLQAQAVAAKQQVEDSQQREMVSTLAVPNGSGF